MDRTKEYLILWRMISYVYDFDVQSVRHIGIIWYCISKFERDIVRWQESSLFKPCCAGCGKGILKLVLCRLAATPHVYKDATAAAVQVEQREKEQFLLSEFCAPAFGRRQRDRDGAIIGRTWSLSSTLPWLLSSSSWNLKDSWSSLSSLPVPVSITGFAYY